MPPASSIRNSDPIDPGHDLSLASARELANAARAAGREVVAVQGLGFVGAAVAAAVAAARDASGEPRFLVFGVDLPTETGRAKIAAINQGRSPIVSPDADLDRLIEEAARTVGNLRATSEPEVYGLADVIVVDIDLDVVDPSSTERENVRVDLSRFEEALRVVGSRMRPEALVVVETTVPLGACERVIQPLLEEERRRRGLEAPLDLAHAYERVMPGPRYVDSIRRFWRTVSANRPEALARVRRFLSAYTDVEAFPTTTLASPTASEMAKLLENSYRATNIAFIHEWTLLAEQTGVNLFEVVESVRIRRGTHDNIRQPGFGVGGYCLTKDALLAQWAARELFGSDLKLGMTLEALRINFEMPRHTLDRTREVLGGELRERRILLCGVSYLPEVGDTRNSPADFFVTCAEGEGAHVLAHDPCIERWEERPDVELVADLSTGIASCDAVVLAIAHPLYCDMAPEALLGAGPRGFVDASNVLSDATAQALRQAGSRVAGVGKGHWRALGYHEAP